MQQNDQSNAGSGDIRLGLVGAGRWGRNYVATIQDLPGTRLAWIADANPYVGAEFASVCAIHHSWRDALTAGGVDGVIVATPPRYHGEIARDALGAGLAVLIEKPLTANPAEARGLLPLAETAGVPVWIDHLHLFAPGYGRLKSLARDLGPIRRIVSTGGRRGPFRLDAPVLWDWGPHDVALCLDMIGETPVGIAAESLEWQDTPDGLGETLALNLQFAGGCRAEIEIGNLYAEKRRRFEVEFDGVSLIYDAHAEHKLVRRSESDGVPIHETVPVAGEPPLTYAVLGFTDAIRSGSTDLGPLRLGIGVVEVLAACEELLSR